jgi:ATP-binding cassette subfamily B protein
VLKHFQNRLESKAYDTTSIILRVLNEYGPAYWKRYALALFFMAVVAGSTSLTAYLVAQAVDQTYIHRNFEAIIVFCITIIVLFSIKGIAVYTQALISARIGFDINADVQKKIFDKLLRAELGFFNDRHSAEFVGRLTHAANAPGSVLTVLITAVGRDALTLIGLVTVMIIRDPLMAVIAFITMPLAILFVRTIVSQVRKYANDQFIANVEISDTMQELVRGFGVIKAFSLDDEFRRRVFEQVQVLKLNSDTLARLSNKSSPLMEALGGFTIALLFLYTGYRVVYFNATAGEFSSFIAAFLLAYDPARRLTRINIGLGHHIAHLRILYELIDTPESDATDEFKPPLVVTRGRVEFTNVNFAYRKGENVLRDMSFVAEAGQITALVGPSGGGKSTTLNLAMRLYEVERGTITIDDQDISERTRGSLRRQIAYVGQDVFLFRSSIRDNIRFGKLDATDEEIIIAAKAAHAHEFIMNFPGGYSTFCGEHGLQLSTGQRQRISIARALLKNAPIIQLDEATAALDSESERYVQDAIAHLCKNRTTIVVAHRLQTIIHAHRILFVERGSVVEWGTHEELLQRASRYSSFYQLQFGEELKRSQNRP